MAYYHNGDVARAVKLYFRQAKRDGFDTPSQPNRHLCEQVGDVIVLRNIHGELARYKVLPSGRLRTLEVEAA